MVLRTLKSERIKCVYELSRSAVMDLKESQTLLFTIYILEAADITSLQMRLLKGAIEDMIEQYSKLL